MEMNEEPVCSFEKLTDAQQLKKLQNRKRNFGIELGQLIEDGDKIALKEAIIILELQIENLKKKIDNKGKSYNFQGKEVICRKCKKPIEEGRIKIYLEEFRYLPDLCVSCEIDENGSFLCPSFLFSKKLIPSIS